ncbi:hypothetical protein DMUE_3520 [Dictyocoela muelleri]|nr:hypothetical protein DMUE_3520 [Dictyocoela muelleri]
MNTNSEAYRKFQKTLNTGTSQKLSDRIREYEKSCKPNTHKNSFRDHIMRDLYDNDEKKHVWSVRKMSDNWGTLNSLNEQNVKYKRIIEPRYQIKFDEIKNDLEKCLTPEKILNMKYRDQNGYWLMAEVKYRNSRKKLSSKGD